ncbi:MAG: transcription antitermination factor NusB [Pseudomonadota bacterium]
MSETASSTRARLRRASRLAAVQALYQMEVSGQGASSVVKQFREHRFGHSGEPGDLIEADEDFFEDLVAGIIGAQARVDQTLSSSLKEGWKFSRLDATVRAILRAGGYELAERHDVPTAVVIDEYVDIAKAFFEGPEPAFVNGALDSFAKVSRTMPEA